MKISVASIFMICFSLQLQGQIIFEKTFGLPGNQSAVEAIQSLSGDFYILSVNDSGQNGSVDFLLSKTDSNGDLIWSRNYGTTSNDVPTGLVEMSNGKIVICGTTQFNGMANSDILVIALDTSGTILWNKTYGGIENEFAGKMVASVDSSVVIAAQTYSFGSVTSSGYVIKINGSGSVSWSVVSEGIAAANSGFTSITNTIDGGYAVTGYRQTIGYIYTPVVKIDAFGSVIANVGITALSLRGYDIKSIPGGDFIVVGKTSTATDSGSVLAIRVNPVSLSLNYVRQYSSALTEYATSVVVTPDGNIAFAGTGLFNNGFATNPKGFLVKINLAGSVLYAKHYTPSLFNSGLNVIINTNDNNLVLCGNSISVLDSSRDTYFIKASLVNGYSGCFPASFGFSTSLVNNVLNSGANNGFGALSAATPVTQFQESPLVVTHCSTILAVSDMTTPLGQVSIVPNPFSNQATLTLSSTFALREAELQLFSADGKMVVKKSFTGNTTTLQRNNMAAGLYFYLVVTDNAIVAKGKLCVN